MANIHKPFFLLFLQASTLFAAPPVHQKEFEYFNVIENEALPPSSKLKTMTGTWGGSRTYLENHGFTISSSYVTDTLGNPSGGQARGFAYCGSFGLSVDLDFGKACGLTGFEFFSSVVWRTGTNLSARKINNQFSVAQVFGTQTVVLNELYLKQSFFNNRLVFKAGRLDAANDFLASPFYAQFVNNAFDGNPVAIFNNFSSFSVFPNATWGAYLSFKLIEQLRAQFGVFNANSKIFHDKYHGINFTFSSTNGVIWITEWAYLLNQGLKDRGMPGNYKAGFLYQTGNAQEFKDGVVHGNYSYYFLIDQMVYRVGGPGTDQGLTPFAALLVAPTNRNLFPFFFMGGLVYKGLFSSRPRDTTNIGVAYGHYSADLRAVESAAKKMGLLGPFGNRPQTAETILELNHWFQINDWFTFTPDVQYIINPKGYGTIRNAFVLGAQIGVVL